MIDNQEMIRVLAEKIQDAGEYRTSLHIRGGGSKQFFTGQPKESDFIDCTAYNGIVSYEPSELVITVRAGTPLRSVESMLASKGQQFPFEPPAFSGQATIGGMIASGFSGPRRPYAGAVRDAILGLKIINGKGEVLEFGGQVIKNVAGYDISRLITGSFGTLGLILEASIKVVPKPKSEISLEQEVSAGDDLFKKIRAIRMETNNLTGLASDGEKIYCRIAGGERSVRSTAARIGGEISEDTEDFWRRLKDHDLDFFRSEEPLWRLSLPPATKNIDFGGSQVIDWGGALRWVKSSWSEDEMSTLAESAGGNAMLFRSPEKDSMQIESLSEDIESLHQRIRESFDPQSVFNPDYMIAGD